MNGNTSNPTENHDASYFDLHTKGTGFIQRLRRVSQKKGPSYFALDLIALHGDAGAANSTRLDCNVTGPLAERDVAFIEKLAREAPPADLTHPERGPRLQVGFTVGDLRVETFTYQHGQKQGQTGVSLKVRLIRLSWLKLNGKRVAMPSETAAAQQQTEVSAAVPSMPATAETTI